MLLASRVDGQAVSGLPLDDRGLAYGDGLFETVRVSGGRAPLLDFHCERLQRGALRLQLALDLEQLQAEVAAFLAALAAAGHAGCTLKILITRGSAGRGYRPAAAAPVRRLLLAFPPADWPAAHARDGVALYECATRLALQPALAGLKHLNRLEQVLARAEWDDPALAEGLLLDSEGRVVEGTMSNLFLVRDQALVTPRLHRCGVAGVMRALVMARALSLGLPLAERDVGRAELDEADEVFVCNSSIGIWPVVRVGARQWQPGPLTRQLQASIAGLWSAP